MKNFEKTVDENKPRKIIIHNCSENLSTTECLYAVKDIDFEQKKCVTKAKTWYFKDMWVFHENKGNTIVCRVTDIKRGENNLDFSVKKS